MKRKDIVKIDNQEVTLESQKEFSDFKRQYNKYNFMQENQINTWKAKLKDSTDDPVPEITIADVMKLLLEMKNNFEERFDRIETRLDKQDERMNKHWARMDGHWGIE